MALNGGAEPAATTLHLVRHAAHDRVDAMLCGRMQGVPLGALGKAQAEALARRLADEPVAAVYASPLQRCRETATPIAAALGCEVRIAEAVNEIDYGEWTGARFDRLGADARWRVWNESRATAAPPGGESMAAVQERVLAGMESWRRGHPGCAVVAVTHSDVIKAAICGVLGLSLDCIHAIDIQPASITTLVLWRGGGKLVGLDQGVALDRAAASPTRRSEMASA